MVTKSAAGEEEDLRAEIKEVREQMNRIQSLLEQQAKQAPEASSASEDADFDASGLADATDRLREYLEGLGIRTDVIDRINEDIHQHPLRNLAIAAGIGWIIGRISGRHS